MSWRENLCTYFCILIFHQPNLVVSRGHFVLVQGDHLGVQLPIMTFSLEERKLTISKFLKYLNSFQSGVNQLGLQNLSRDYD